MSNQLVVRQSLSFLNEFLMNFASKHTQLAYKRDLEDFLEFGNFSHITDVNIGDLIQYRDFMFSEGKAPGTVQRKLSSVKSLFDWCVVRGIMTSNPATSLKMPKASVKSPTLAFTDEEVSNLLEIPDSSTFTGNLHKLILVFLFNLGLRRSELVSIKLEDIYEDRGVTVLRIKGKGDKVRVLPLSDTLVVNLKEYLKNYGTVLDQKDYLFQSHKDIRNVQAMSGTTVYKIVNKYAKILGITKRVGAHSCRATVISHLLENSVSPRDVANFAGHSSINTTVGIYDKRRDEIKNSAAYKVKF